MSSPATGVSSGLRRAVSFSLVLKSPSPLRSYGFSHMVRWVFSFFHSRHRHYRRVFKQLFGAQSWPFPPCSGEPGISCPWLTNISGVCSWSQTSPLHLLLSMTDRTGYTSAPSLLRCDTVLPASQENLHTVLTSLTHPLLASFSSLSRFPAPISVSWGHLPNKWPALNSSFQSPWVEEFKQTHARGLQLAGVLHGRLVVPHHH